MSELLGGSREEGDDDVVRTEVQDSVLSHTREVSVSDQNDTLSSE